MGIPKHKSRGGMVPPLRQCLHNIQKRRIPLDAVGESAMHFPTNCRCCGARTVQVLKPAFWFGLSDLPVIYLNAKLHGYMTQLPESPDKIHQRTTVVILTRTRHPQRICTSTRTRPDRVVFLLTQWITADTYQPQKSTWCKFGGIWDAM